MGEPTAAAVRRALHCPHWRMRYFGDQRVIGSMHVGSGLAEVKHHESWRVRTLTFEVETA